jgi:AcrR family transcriptional regulator
VLDRNVNDVHNMNMVHEMISSGDDMPTTDRRSRKRRARMDGILDMAMAMLAEDGLEGFTTHALARRLDVAVGALYRYFPSKGAIIAALERRVVSELGAELADVLTAVEERLCGEDEDWAHLAPIVALAAAFRERTEARPERMRLIGRIMAEPDHILPREEGERVIADALGLLNVLKRPFGAAVTAGVLSEGDGILRSLLFWSGLRSVLQTFKLETFAPSVIRPTALYHGMVDSLLCGWGAESSDVVRARAEVAAWRASEEV